MTAIFFEIMLDKTHCYSEVGLSLLAGLPTFHVGPADQGRYPIIDDLFMDTITFFPANEPRSSRCNQPLK